MRRSPNRLLAIRRPALLGDVSDDVDSSFTALVVNGPIVSLRGDHSKLESPIAKGGVW